MRTTNHTYMRPALTNTTKGQCPCCLKMHRTTKKGLMVRHGWKETGRQVGVLGQGYQWGACSGGGMRPLEQTDSDARTIMRGIQADIERAEALLVEHETGRDTYTETHQFVVYRHDGEERIQRTGEALTALGLEWKAVDTQVRKKAARVYYADAKKFLITVPRDFAGADIPRSAISGLSYQRGTDFSVRSWDELRQAYVRDLQHTLKGLRDLHKAIEDACEHHLNNPTP